MTPDIKSELISEKCEGCGQPVYAGQGYNSQTLNHWECKKKVLLTKLNKAEHEKELESVLGSVKLLCDGYEVSLQVEKSGMKLVVATYVNGVFRGVWMDPSNGEDHPERKFLNKKTVRAYSPQKKAALIKKIGKKRAYEIFDLDRETFYYSPAWNSGKTAINHMLKVCKSVEVYV